jgi:5-hydroxyisourate hydrolase-like protein (transthyretin family)
VQLYYQGKPQSDAQVEIFDSAPDGTVHISLIRTDAQGRAVIPVASGHSYLLDAVRLRSYDGPQEAVWESLWASLTFAVP